MFPDFNFYSTPLLILAIQGLVFAFLLLRRYFKKKNNSDFFLGSILLITVWHQTCYTLGFMAWYDTFRNTKINYFLLELSFFLAPTIFFYISSITTPHYRLNSKKYLHFIPGIIYILFKAFVYCYDASQANFNEQQNGYLTTNLELPYTNYIFFVLISIQMGIYLFFSFRKFYIYRNKLDHIFSNTYALQLNWIRNFLIIYGVLFLYFTFQEVINVTLTDLTWIQEWWYFFFTSIAIVYVGMVGYFTNTNKLNKIKPEEKDIFSTIPHLQNLAPPKEKLSSSKDFEEKKSALKRYMQTKKPFLDPDLNLIDLAKALNMSRAKLSNLINNGIGKNFNDYINEQRIDAIKAEINAGKHKELSLLGLALSCGFNSKATFNRVFKKVTGSTPSQYVKNKQRAD